MDSCRPIIGRGDPKPWVLELLGGMEGGDGAVHVTVRHVFLALPLPLFGSKMEAGVLWGRGGAARYTGMGNEQRGGPPPPLSPGGSFVGPATGYGERPLFQNNFA